MDKVEIILNLHDKVAPRRRFEHGTRNHEQRLLRKVWTRYI